MNDSSNYSKIIINLNKDIEKFWKRSTRQWKLRESERTERKRLRNKRKPEEK